ncbi:hypothetical protein FNV43_RR11044 [Rhamnella rubrinervis]|uniref:Uncharacterized protein n=1 Tax=Rhamnella rubrinervis TaxID=2594499 RepID=A0A8K0MHD1_9ROSA|nr:hypothetical protein FNV43_RR11044 [Rhamnella rubrinervis]
MKANLNNARLWKLEQVSAEPLSAAEEGLSKHAVDPSVVDAIKNIKAGKRPTSEPTSRRNTFKSRRMANIFSKSATPSKSTRSTGVGPGQMPTSRVTRSQVDRELAECYQAQVDKDNVERMSLGAINSSLQVAYQAMVTAQQLKNVKEELSSSKKSLQTLEGKCLSQIDKKYQGSKTLLKNKEKEVEGLKKTIQELTVELDEFKKEESENVMLGYSIMRRVVACKFPYCNMIELDQLAAEEA